jgi:hypothetical protein
MSHSISSRTKANYFITTMCRFEVLYLLSRDLRQLQALVVRAKNAFQKRIPSAMTITLPVKTTHTRKNPKIIAAASE